MSKTRFALYFYYLAIGLLTACAVTIVVKLIVYPPCAPQGNSCIVDPWSAAGLEGAVLGVSATVLAILGAVAVAGWWTTLDRRVKDQVGVLYEDHKAEIGQKLDNYVAAQQLEMSDRLGTVQKSLQSVESRIGVATTDLDKLEELTHDFLDVAVDGIMLLSASGLEKWAQKVTALHKFPQVPLKMAERYLDALEAGLAEAEQELFDDQTKLSTHFQEFKEVAAISDTHTDEDKIMHIIQAKMVNDHYSKWLERDAKGVFQLANTLKNWEGLLLWKTIAGDEKADPASLQWLDGKIGAYQFKIDQLKLGHAQLKEHTQLLIDLTERYLQTHNVEQYISGTTQ